jgi:hypothetical protein
VSIPKQTVRLPQLLLDTDAKNEQDDQHYLGYALFSELDILGINSVHHGGGQEPINYAEIRHVIDLSRQSGLPEHRVPLVFRGADQRLAVPESGRWDDTEPIVTDASEAILAAARGASPDNPVWIVPVGPGTNVASAILQARREGFELKDRIRIMWLGGSNNEIINEFNGNNDPWSMYVVVTAASRRGSCPPRSGRGSPSTRRTEGHLYADHPLGQYLKSIMPARNKALYDASCLSAIISKHLDLGWVKEPSRSSWPDRRKAIAGPDRRAADAGPRHPPDRSEGHATRPVQYHEGPTHAPDRSRRESPILTCCLLVEYHTHG